METYMPSLCDQISEDVKDVHEEKQLLSVITLPYYNEEAILQWILPVYAVHDPVGSIVRYCDVPQGILDYIRGYQYIPFIFHMLMFY